MKKQTLRLIAMFFATTFIVSCSSNSESGSIGDEKLAAEQNASEENIIPVASLENGLLINGATKKTGTPPAPNSNIDFTIGTDNGTGFQKSGIKIKFSATDDVKGAYIRFKDVDGNATTSYFDVPATSFGYRGTTKIKKEVLFHATEKSTENRAITVNFKDVIPPGKFCYDICIYDSANNVSQIETVCVTIESWGGNAAMVGNWSLDRIENTEDLEEIECTGGGKVSFYYENEIISRDVVLSFKDNGAYNDEVKTVSKHLNYSETVNTCSLVYEPEEREEFARTGNWAFNEEEKELTIVMFKYDDLIDAQNSEEYEFGDSVFSGITLKEITGSTMILEEEIGSGDKKITYYFKRI
ncbi:conserved protein of unknown function [Tenacibaculum sp. 190130A14a]|uniref:Lipoprotein n=1 Tax=Tenacibaculum polynesiense TaxID=3137857 RepID=A0ABM9P8X9_9FLAO